MGNWDYRNEIAAIFDLCKIERKKTTVCVSFLSGISAHAIQVSWRGQTSGLFSMSRTPSLDLYDRLNKSEEFSSNDITKASLV